MSRKLIFAAAVALGLMIASSCSSDPSKPSRPIPPAQSSMPTSAIPDQCGAGELAWLVGHPKTDIPTPTDSRPRRVTCTACPVTMDYNPTRLNIFYDAETGIVKVVKCG